ncbi:hypothetical protein MMC08_002988, partial [Hypocenomyce scalaris]|nr:hypothetical protein [Hypocenomyce scalaris]
MASPSNSTDWATFNLNLCTIQICPLSLAHVKYFPNLAGNALYLAIFSLLLFIQAFLGIRYRTWGFMTGLLFGLLGEIIGYAGRVQMHFNIWTFNPFL